MSGATKKTFAGTAADIGADVFIEAVMPIIRQAAQKMTPQQLASLYSGFIGAAFGSVEADFGKSFANSLVQKMSTTYIDGQPLDEVRMQ